MHAITKHRHWRAAIAAMVIAALISLDGCTMGGRREGYVHLRLKGDPTTLDPARIVDVAGGTIAAKIFSGLVRLGDGLQIVPDLAASWTVSPDGLTYTFRLRRGVMFSSGRELYAHDVKYSFERILDPEGPGIKTWIFERIVGAREYMDGKADEIVGIVITDDYGITITLTEPYSPFLGLLTMPAAYVVPFEEVLHWETEFSAHPVGTGPFKLERWAPNQRIVLRRHDQYFGGRPDIEGIVYRIIPEDITAVAEFELGNLDVLEVPQAVSARYTASGKWQGLVSQSAGLNTYYLGLNNRSPVFGDPEVRLAAAMSIDRQRILSTIYEGQGELARGPVPSQLRSWEAPPEAHAYSPEEARRILSSRPPGSRTVSFYITSERQVVDMAEIIQSYMNAAGFDVRIKQLEWSAFKEAVNRGEADMFWLSWWADYPDPENFLYPLFHSSNHGAGGNRVQYANPEVDSLIENGQRAANPTLRDTYYQAAEDAIVHDVPWVFFWHRSEYIVRQPWMDPIEGYPVYTMDKGLEFSFTAPPGKSWP